jgi:hypothetical protein
MLMEAASLTGQKEAQRMTAERKDKVGKFKTRVCLSSDRVLGVGCSSIFCF